MREHVLTIGLTVAALWGIAPVIHKYLLSSDVDAKTIMVIGGISYFLVLLVYWWMYAGEIQKSIARISFMDVILICIASVVMNFVAKILYLYALQKHESSIVSALVYSAPLFTFVCAVVLLKERITLWKLGGIILIVIGACILAYK